MNRPKFTGPDAELAAYRWAQLSTSRQIWRSVSTVAQSILMGRSGVSETPDDSVVLDATVHTIYQRKPGSPINTLVEIAKINNNIATVLLDIYKSLDDLAEATADQLAVIVYTKSGKTIGKTAAAQILESVRNYINS